LWVVLVGLVVRLLPLVYFVCIRSAFTFFFFKKIALIKNENVGSSDDTIDDTEPSRNGGFVAKNGYFSVRLGLRKEKNNKCDFKSNRRT
jgi:hypothetical protein